MQLRIAKDDITRTRTAASEPHEPGPGEVRVRIDRFGYSANNVTYAAAGDTLGYWKFFPCDEPEWGLVPVWGYADVEASRCEGVSEGERLFGYFPPARTLLLQPTRPSAAGFVDGAAHRAELPSGYNLYRRVEKRDAEAEARHMLLYPLLVTSWCLHDAMRSEDWHGAERVVIASASSKTAIGTAFALARDEGAPPVTGLTSARNVAFVRDLGLYDEVLAYGDLDALDRQVPTAIVDMSGDAAMLGRLHTHLGDAMRQTLDVGLTHWEAPRRDGGRIRERSRFFFAPAHIAGRIKEWDMDTFTERTEAFIAAAIADSARWMRLQPVDGLEALGNEHARIARGEGDASVGLVVTP